MKPIILIVLLSSCLLLQGQHMMPGHVIDRQGQQRTGSLMLKKWRFNEPDSIIFSGKPGERLVLKPRDVRSFEIYGHAAYASVRRIRYAVAHVDSSLEQNNYFKRIIDRHSRVQWVFCRILISGSKFDLYISPHPDMGFAYFLADRERQDTIELKSCPCNAVDHRCTDEHNAFRAVLLQLAEREGFGRYEMEPFRQATLHSLEQMVLLLNRGNAFVRKYKTRRSCRFSF